MVDREDVRLYIEGKRINTEARETEESFMTGCLFRFVLPELARQFPEVKKALKPRIEGGLNDVQMSYFSYMPGITEVDFPESLDNKFARLATSLDIIMCNNREPLERRKEIIDKFKKFKEINGG